MLVPQRRDAIMQFIRQKHSASVAELSAMLYISETSIRRDLTYLEKVGMVRKTYGGAVLVTGENEVLSLDARKETEKEAKSRIAHKAIRLIHHGDVIFLDSSSTALAMVPLMGEFVSLTVITNGARIALSLLEHPSIQVYCTGGQLMPNIYSYNGALARKTIEGMHADKVFVSPKGLDLAQGAYCASEEEAAIRRAMIDNSSQTILLCAAQKLGKRATFHLCNLNEIHTLVCDIAPGEQWRQTFDHHRITCL